MVFRGEGRLKEFPAHCRMLAPPGYLNLARIAKLRDVTGQSCCAQAQGVGRSLSGPQAHHHLRTPLVFCDTSQKIARPWTRSNKSKIFEKLLSAAPPAPRERQFLLTVLGEKTWALEAGDRTNSSIEIVPSELFVAWRRPTH